MRLSAYRYLLMKLPGPYAGTGKVAAKYPVSAKHLLSLINDLLDWPGNPARSSLTPNRFRQSVVEEVIATLRSMAENKGLKLVASLPEGDLVVADRRALPGPAQPTHNAIKFGKRRSKGRLRYLVGSGRRVEFNVIDTGSNQVRRTRSSCLKPSPGWSIQLHRHEGAGLGLHLVDANRPAGRPDRFCSEHGKGSVFTLISTCRGFRIPTIQQQRHWCNLARLWSLLVQTFPPYRREEVNRPENPGDRRQSYKSGTHDLFAAGFQLPCSPHPTGRRIALAGRKRWT